MRLVPETSDRRDEVRALLLDVFEQPSEARLVDLLIGDGDARIALVAMDETEVVGYVMLSCMRKPAASLALGPVAVRPKWRRRGIGASLIDAAIERARAQDWKLIFVLGDPSYYGRFGFSVETGRRFQSPYAGPYFMALALTEEGAAGAESACEYPDAFAKLF